MQNRGMKAIAFSTNRQKPGVLNQGLIKEILLLSKAQKI